MTAIGLRKYDALFTAQEYDMGALRASTKADLREIGLPLGPIVKMLGYLKRSRQSVQTVPQLQTPAPALAPTYGKNPAPVLDRPELVVPRATRATAVELFPPPPAPMLSFGDGHEQGTTSAMSSLWMSPTAVDRGDRTRQARDQIEAEQVQQAGAPGDRLQYFETQEQEQLRASAEAQMRSFEVRYSTLCAVQFPSR